MWVLDSITGTVCTSGVSHAVHVFLSFHMFHHTIHLISHVNYFHWNNVLFNFQIEIFSHDSFIFTSGMVISFFTVITYLLYMVSIFVAQNVYGIIMSSLFFYLSLSQTILY